MTTPTPVPSADRKANKRPRRPSKRPTRSVRPLRFYSDEKREWLNHESIRLHLAATRLPELEENDYQRLKREIARGDGTVHLTTPIVVTSKGWIVDGRHRARILVESGHENELIGQIEAKHGDWIEQLPDEEDPFIHSAKAQKLRRNVRNWRIAWSLYEKYLEAAKQGNRMRGKTTRKRGTKSPVAALCDELGFSKAVFCQVARVRRSASAEDIAAVEAGTLSLNAVIRKLDEEKACGDACNTEMSRRRGSAGSPPSRAGNAKSGRGGTGAGTSKKRRTEGDGRDRVAQLINELLESSPEDVAIAHADAILASLDALPLQRLADAVRRLDSKSSA